MGQKLKIAGWVSVGVVAGALTTVSLQTVARGAMTPLPLEEIQQLSAVFGMVKTDYVEPVDDKKLITDAISGMVSSLDPHSQYFDKKSFQGISRRHHGALCGRGHRNHPGRRADQGGLAHRGLARLPRRAQNQRPDHQDRRHRRQGPVAERSRQEACAASPTPRSR
jgi:hypothetical protein